MRVLAFTLLLGGSMAFGQAPSPTLQAPQPQFSFPAGPGQAAPAAAPRTWTLKELPPGPVFSLPNQPLTRQLILPQVAVKPGLDLQVDPGMIVHPPSGSFAGQPTRIPMASRLYPDLKMLPVEEARLEPLQGEWAAQKLEPIPTTAPKFRLEPIPTTWPAFKLALTESPAKK